MPVPNRKDNPDALEKYAENITSDAQKIDFFLNNYVLTTTLTELKNEEQQVAADLEEEFYSPTKEGPDGKEVYDMDLVKKRMKLFTDMQVRQRLKAGQEYKRHMDSAPQDCPNKSAYAALLTSKGPFMELSSLSFVTVSFFGMKEYGSISGKDLYAESVAQSEKELLATLSDEEAELFRIGSDLADREPRLLHHVKPQDAGLTNEQLDQIYEENISVLSSQLDRNWMHSATRKNRPAFLDSSISSDANSRMPHHYAALENNDDRIDFLEGTAFADEVTYDIVGEFGINAEKKHYNLFSETEKQQLPGIKTDFFNPEKPDGTLDKDEFERRMDSLAARIAKHRVEQGKFAKSGDMSAITKSDDIETRQYVASLISSDAYRAAALDAMFKKAVADGTIDHSLMVDYCQRKGRLMDSMAEDQIGESFKAAFKKSVKDSAYKSSKEGREYYSLSSVSPLAEGDKPALSEEETKELAKRTDAAKRSIASNIRRNKVWLSPEDNINMESLKRLDNLYDQFKKEDSIFHWNSTEYEKLRAALKQAHEQYVQASQRGGELTDAEKTKLVPLYDEVSERAYNYLKDKAEKERTYDLGKNRYAIAFSALNVASRGRAKEQLHIHNANRIRHGSKTISVNDLIDRSTRNNTQQKQREKMVKEGSKNRHAEKASAAGKNGNAL